LKKVGFIGLGVMGKPMAKNLVKAGYPLTVHDVSRPRVDELVGEGAAPASCPKEVAENSAVIITMLPGPPEVEQVILGDNGVLKSAQEGSIIVDMTAGSPSLARKIADESAKRHVKSLDAPVSGGEEGAIHATLVIAVGGERSTFDECSDIFATMGRTVIYVGNAGAGQAAKLANQIVVAINIASLAEGLIFAVKAGVEPEVAYRVMKAGLAGSAVLDLKGPRILARNFAGGGKLKYHLTQLDSVLQTSRELGFPLILTAVTHQAILQLCKEGKGDLDHSCIANFFERLANVEIRARGTSM